MKLAIYHPWIYLHGGLERTILELVTRSRHEWKVYTGYYEPRGTFPGFAKHSVTTLRPTSVNRAFGSVIKSALQVGFQKLPLDADVEGVVVCCDGIGDLVAFRNRSVPLFNLCFTPLRAAFDPVYEKKALGSRTFVERLIYRSLKYSFRFADRQAWRHYQWVTAISEEVKNRIVSGGLFDRDSITVAYPGIDWEEASPNLAYEPLILLAGRIMWTKNIELAVEAFAAVNAPAPWKLVIAGYVDVKSQIYLSTLRQLTKELDATDKIEFVVSPSDEAMSDLFRRASFCLFTPLNEDWGIVPLESMRHAKAVVAVDCGGPRESIVNGYSGFLLPPLASDWTAAITSLIENPALTRRLGNQAHIHVKRFTWDNFVTEIDDSIERCLLAKGKVPVPQSVETERVPDLAS
jgi:glycosyltransferase involved in cell wall biosynthesis